MRPRSRTGDATFCSVEPSANPPASAPSPDAAVSAVPHGTVAPGLVRSYTTVSRIGGAIVAVAGFTILTGWILDRRDLLGLATNDAMKAMQPQSAMLFAAIGLAVVAMSRSMATPRRRILSRILSGVCLAMGTVFLIEHLTEIDFGVDALLLPDRLDAAGLPGRPTAVTATVFVLLGAGAFLVTLRRNLVVGFGQALAMGATCLGGVVGIGVFYGASASSGFPFGVRATSLTASALTIIAGLAITLAIPDRGLMSPLSQDGPGGLMLRRILPVALLLPVAGLAFVVRAVVSGDMGEPRALAGVAIVVTASLVALALFAAHQIDELERRRWRAVEAAIRAEESVSQNVRIVELLGEALRPPIHVPNTDVDVAGWYQPAVGLAAGDAFEVLPLSDNRIAIVMVDATGHGAEPALAALAVKNGLVQGLMVGATPAECVRAAWQRLRSGTGATTVVMILDASAGAVTYVNAGHPPIIRLSASGANHQYAATGPLLHPDLPGDWEEERITVEDGDVILTFTDGLADPVADDRGGISMEQLMVTVSERPERDVDEIIASVAETVGRYASQRLRDDAALVLLRFGTRPSLLPTMDRRQTSSADERPIAGTTSMPPNQVPR